MFITGDMLREAREECSISLSEMARRIYLDKGYLSRIETRRSAAPDHIVTQYEQVLGVNLNRRSLVAGLAAGALLPDAVADAVRRGIAEEPTGPLSVDEWMAKADTYAADAMTTGASEIQLRIASELVLLQGRLTEPRMWAVAARLMVLHGAPLASVTDSVATERWYRSAVVAADRSEDISIRVWVRGRSALNMAHPSASLRVCEELASEARKLSDGATVGKLMALVSLANVAALRGDTGGSTALLEDVKRIFDHVGSTSQTASEHSMPEWRMGVDESLVLSRLGDPRADKAHAQTIARIPRSLPRFATHLELHQALALANVGERVAGVAHAREALHRLPVAKHSVALRRLFTEVAS